MIYLLIIIMLVLAWKKPSISLALLTQLYLIRSTFNIDFNDINYREYINSDPVIGAILPVLCFTLIVFRVIKEKRHLRLILDKVDFLIGFIVFTLSVSTVFSHDLFSSLEYNMRFLVLTLPFYLVTKLYFLSLDKDEELKAQLIVFIKTIVILSTILGLFAVYVKLFVYDNVIPFRRITMSKTHPIPFAQLIGLSALILSYSSFFKLYFFDKKWTSIMLVINILILFLSNTRGIILSYLICLLLFILVERITVKKFQKVVFIGLPVSLVSIAILFLKVDLTIVFNRFLNISTDESIKIRLRTYQESFYIFFDTYLLGSGPGVFKYFHTGFYPHNFFLENISSYGLLGLFFSLLFIIYLIWMNVKYIKDFYAKSFTYFSVLLVNFFFIETMFSFTLWMHKGLFLSLALFSVVSLRKV